MDGESHRGFISTLTNGERSIKTHEKSRNSFVLVRESSFPCCKHGSRMSRSIFKGTFQRSCDSPTLEEGPEHRVNVTETESSNLSGLRAASKSSLTARFVARPTAADHSGNLPIEQALINLAEVPPVCAISIFDEHWVTLGHLSKLLGCERKDYPGGFAGAWITAEVEFL